MTTTQDYDPDLLRQEAEKLAPVSPLMLSLIQPSPTNPRKHFHGADQAEMVESIKRHGILQPILVRLWPATAPWGDGPMPLYELVAGERRYRAAKAAGLASIPGMVRALTDLEVLEIQIIENLQRRDLHPLEEAEGYERMMSHHGYTAEDLGDKIGKSKAYIYARLKLLALSEEGRRLFYSGLLTPSTALLVARVPTKALQAKALKEITEKDYTGDTMSVRKAKDLLQKRYMLKLADAPFPTTYRDLIATAGACNDCPHRTGNQPEIYDDIDNADVCTNPDCYTAKKLAYAELLAAEAKAQGHAVITGKQAEKIAPHGISSYSSPSDKYIGLDNKCYEDKEQRTYRELLGEDVPIILLEDVSKQILVPVIENKVLAEKLKAIGIISSREKDAKRQAEVANKAKLENDYRARLFARIRDESEKLTYDTGPILDTEPYTELIRLLTKQFLSRTYDDDCKRLAKLWNIEGKNDTARVEALMLGIEAMSARECWLLLMDATVISQTVSNSWSMDHEPTRLLKMASVFGVDPAEIRAEIKAEAREKAKPPTKAAQAQKKPAPAKKAAPAADKSATPKKAGKTKKDIIEPYEKPTAAEPSTSLPGARRKDDIEPHEKPADAEAPTRCQNTIDMLEAAQCTG